jgi:hypothetical protein
LVKHIRSSIGWELVLNLANQVGQPKDVAHRIVAEKCPDYYGIGPDFSINYWLQNPENSGFFEIFGQKIGPGPHKSSPVAKLSLVGRRL